MKTSDKIKHLINTLNKADSFCACIIEGAPGWGKTSAVSHALASLNIKAVHLGTYATPLGLFNFLLQHSSEMILIDDTSGLFNNPQTMAILKAATWEDPSRGRVIRWTSTTEKALSDEFVFRGKIIIICNSFPKTADAEAVRNRALEQRVEPSLSEAMLLLTEAIGDTAKFKDQALARKVLKTILKNLTEETLERTSYRTLQRIYEIALHNPECWEQMLGNAGSPISTDPMKLLRQLSKQKLKVKDQLRIFEQETGLKRRTFFKYRQQIEV